MKVKEKVWSGFPEVLGNDLLDLVLVLHYSISFRSSRN